MRHLRILFALLFAFSTLAAGYYPPQLPVATGADGSDILTLWQDNYLKQISVDNFTASLVVTSTPPTITITGAATGSGTTSIALTLANSGVEAGTWGAALSVPSFFVNAKGLITSITNYTLPSYQPLDSDLTALAALNTASFGRSLLEYVDSATFRSNLSIQTADSDLSAIAALSTDSFGRGLLPLTTAASVRSYISAQTLNSELSALSLVAGDPFGRELLGKANGAAVISYIGAQTADSDLSAIAALNTAAAGRGLLELTTTNGILDYVYGQARDSDLTAISAVNTAAWGRDWLTNASTAQALVHLGTITVNGNTVTTGTGTLTLGASKTLTVNQTTTLDRQSSTGLPVELIVAMSDETTAITTGTAKVTMRAPWAFTVTSVRASLNTVSSSGIPTVDINESGTTILSTKLTIDASELTSTTAATAAVISDTSIADDAELTFDIDVAGTGAKGLKVAIYGYR